MKKFLVAFLMLFVGIVANAETLYFRSTGFCQKELRSYGWTSWSAWTNSDVSITINLSTDVITIYSPKTQRYKIVAASNWYYEGTATCIDYRFYDQDGDYGTMTLCMKASGQSEIYIRFANVQWAYVVVRTR